MKKHLFFSTLFLFVSLFAFGQSVKVKTKKNPEKKQIEFFVINDSDFTQEVTLYFAEIKGLKGYDEPVTKQVAPKDKTLFLTLTWDYIYDYKYGIKKKEIRTDTDLAKMAAEKDPHMLMDFSKINEGIVIFDNVECKRCNLATSYMLDQGMDFKIVDITPNEKNAKNRDFMQKTIKEKDKNLAQYITPIFIVNGKMTHSHKDLLAFIKSLK